MFPFLKTTLKQSLKPPRDAHSWPIKIRYETRNTLNTIAKRWWWSTDFSRNTARKIMGHWIEVLAVFVPCLVELVCAIFLVFFGCGSTLNWPQEETSPTVLTVSLSFGFLYAFLGNISTLVSGGFFNPAITAALATIKTIPIKRAVCFIFAQLIGGEIASLLATRGALREERLCIFFENPLTKKTKPRRYKRFQVYALFCRHH